MNTPFWMLILQISNFVLTWGTAAYVFFDRRRGAANQRLSDFEKRLQKAESTLKTPPVDPKWAAFEKQFTDFETALEKRVLAIESAVKNPSVCGSHLRMEDNDKRLFERLDELHGDISELSGGVKGLASTLDTINQYLLHKRG